jgi:hypothetical protein
MYIKFIDNEMMDFYIFSYIFVKLMLGGDPQYFEFRKFAEDHDAV